ncbi:adenylyl cyclase CyaB [Methanobacterium lacus]|uniref:Adenylyl cyclase CyaB n=1 Tax=Methanobacterium lacus (strain AL-21) TaxID=877455 RepID=F0TBU9_METLA|nr:class IV adenylate cyclase [Methanobacterium lacus]ADZ10291.1 adenylyl cyclase CyaB [Methanobacterium lacus]
MIEVEVKAKVKNFSDIKEKLIEMGAQKIKDEYQSDTYFNAHDRDFGVTDEALRIREIPENSGKRFILTYKGAKMDDLSKTRQEVEVDITDSENMALILINLGFKKAAVVTKDRSIYHLDEFIITLDTVHGAGIYVEIETDVEDGKDTTDSLNQIFEIYKTMGIEDGFERRSYLELLGAPK